MSNSVPFIQVPFRFGPGALVRIIEVLLSQDGIEHRIATEFGAHSYVDYLAVDPNIQATGVGTALLEFSHQHQPESWQVTPTVLNTYARRARKFYRAAGFLELGWQLNGAPVWWYVRPPAKAQSASVFEGDAIHIRLRLSTGDAMQVGPSRCTEWWKLTGACVILMHLLASIVLVLVLGQSLASLSVCMPRWPRWHRQGSSKSHSR